MDKYLAKDPVYIKFREMVGKRLLEEQVLKDKQSGKLVEVKNKLTMAQKDGRLEVLYVSNSFTKYEGQFGISDNSSKLLLHLAQNLGKTFSPKDLVKYLNPPRKGAEDASDDRRVRDTVKHIRNKLGLTKNKADDFFLVSRGFGLKCAVEVKV